MLPDQGSRNALIDALPASVRAELVSASRPVAFAPGFALAGADTRVYFPLRGAISLRVESADSVEMVMVVARDGAAGLERVLSMPEPLLRPRPILSGIALAIDSAFLAERIRAVSSIALVLQRYIAYLVDGVAIELLCARRHATEARLARRLAFFFTQTGHPVVAMPLNVMGETIGLERKTTAVALHRLEAAGAIAHARERVRPRDLAQLRALACPCLPLIEERMRQVTGTAKP